MRTVRTGLLVLCLAALASGCTFLHRLEKATLGRMTMTPAAATPALTSAPAAPVQMAQGDLVPPPAWLFNDIACAPLLATQPPPSLRVLGSQDTVINHMLGPGAPLVVSGSSAACLEPG